MIWKGFFEYNLGEGLNEKVDFTLDLSFENNSFSGFSVDRETKTLFREGDVRVKGFIDGQLISFVKKYPYNYFFNEETSRCEIDYSVKNHEVEYQGYFYPEKKKYEGTYRVVIGSEMPGMDGAFREEFYTGYWEMTRLEFTSTEK